jgi:hypothetical protein
MRNPGFYVGTLHLEKPWYARAVKHGGFPDKGPGEYWYDYKGFYFVREKSGTGLLIPADSLVEVSLGHCHGIAFSRAAILKLLWKKGGERLSSGFVIENPELVRQALTTAGWA